MGQKRSLPTITQNNSPNNLTSKAYVLQPNFFKQREPYGRHSTFREAD